ncbi:hypothetical protein pipiens_015115 [Culex pipiens pipiens]|uniref:Uncharacterized protein n=1 Tax=Culex pipiens pipiens TaxID=38569 RepID=A0ABD1CRU0_CULPP
MAIPLVNRVPCPCAFPHPKPVCDYKTLRACFPKHEELFLEFRENAKSVNCYCEQNCVDSKVVIEKMQVRCPSCPEV